MKFNLWTAFLLQLFTNRSYLSITSRSPMQSQALAGQKHILSTFVNSSSQTAAYLDIWCGRPLLMLHGFFGEKTCRLPLIELLQSQFRCISLDMLGFGDSSFPRNPLGCSCRSCFCATTCRTTKYRTMLHHRTFFWRLGGICIFPKIS